MIVRSRLDELEPLTEEELLELERAEKMPIVYDEDCPELTPKLEAAMRKAVKERNRRKQVTFSMKLEKSEHEGAVD